MWPLVNAPVRLCGGDRVARRKVARRRITRLAECPIPKAIPSRIATNITTSLSSVPTCAASAKGPDAKVNFHSEDESNSTHGF